MSVAHATYTVYREDIARLPSITLEIRRTLAEPDVSLVNLSRILAKDPSLRNLCFLVP